MALAPSPLKPKPPLAEFTLYSTLGPINVQVPEQGAILITAPRCIPEPAGVMFEQHKIHLAYSCKNSKIEIKKDEIKITGKYLVAPPNEDFFVFSITIDPSTSTYSWNPPDCAENHTYAPALDHLLVQILSQSTVLVQFIELSINSSPNLLQRVLDLEPKQLPQFPQPTKVFVYKKGSA